MATVLQVTWSSGRRERCDAHCHLARSARCTCCCAGRFHGVGHNPQAFQRTVRAYWAPLLATLRLKEQTGALRIDYARPGYVQPPVIRRGQVQQPTQTHLSF